MHATISERHCRNAAYIALIALAVLLAAQIPSHAASAEEPRERQMVEWWFQTSDDRNEIESKLRAIENEIASKYRWQVEWQGATDLAIEGKMFTGSVQFTNGKLVVIMEFEPTLYVAKSIIRRAFEKELGKHLQLL